MRVAGKCEMREDSFSATTNFEEKFPDAESWRVGKDRCSESEEYLECVLIINHHQHNLAKRYISL